ncbi:MAG: hypothetical protein KDD82_25645 [Planctomycetes bacterium]|nr:hypothetical protein [Planctomycetota bacterium]
MQRATSQVERDDRAFLKLAVDRGYLDPGIARALLREASATRRRAEDLAVQRGHLSMRRLRRLQGHLRFRSLRRSDKAYARLVLELGWVDPAALEQALEDQKLRFATQRERIRLGTLLVERGALSADQDRTLCAQRCEEHDSQMGRTPANSTRLTRTFSAHGPSVRQLEAAVHKVEWLRKLSEQVGQSEHPAGADWSRDSAAAVEAICAARATARREAVEADADWQLAATRTQSDALEAIADHEATLLDPAAHGPPKPNLLRRWLGLAG